MRFYQELSEWWPLFSPPIHYVEEAQDLLRRLAPLPAPGTTTMLELGSGGGSLASHLQDQFKLTLTDLSVGMLAQSRAINPAAEHIQATCERCGSIANSITCWCMMPSAT